jgi:hypothetical protein
MEARDSHIDIDLRKKKLKRSINRSYSRPVSNSASYHFLRNPLATHQNHIKKVSRNPETIHNYHNVEERPNKNYNLHIPENNVRYNIHYENPYKSVSHRPKEFVSRSRNIRGRPIYEPYLRSFPIWLTNYALVMDEIEEKCPRTNEDLEFVEKSYGLCLAICDKSHCIQTANYCCYYVEPEKRLVILDEQK